MAGKNLTPRLWIRNCWSRFLRPHLQLLADRWWDSATFVYTSTTNLFFQLLIGAWFLILRKSQSSKAFICPTPLRGCVNLERSEWKECERLRFAIFSFRLCSSAGEHLLPLWTSFMLARRVPLLQPAWPSRRTHRTPRRRSPSRPLPQRPRR